MNALERICQAAEQHGKRVQRRGNHAQIQCPAHPDRNPSLSVDQRGDQAVVKCHAGCGTDDIVRELGLEMRDLFDDNKGDGELGSPIASYEYRTPNGRLVGRIVRYHPKDFRPQVPDSAGGWRFGGFPQPRPLYRGHKLTTDGPVWVVEGEKDADRLSEHVDNVVTWAHGAKSWSKADWAPVAGREVKIVADADAEGRQAAQDLGNHLGLNYDCKVTLLEPGAGKDISDHLDAGLSREQLLPLDTEMATEPDDREPHGWEPTPLGPIIDADYKPPVPEVGERDDGTCLFYRGRINSIFGESGTGKSWIAMWVCAHTLTAGENVVYIDLEDHPASVVARFRALGVSDGALVRHLSYISPQMPLRGEAADHLDELAQGATVAVVDSVGEALAMQGAGQNDDGEVAQWYRMLPRRLAHAGCAVITLDHVPKAHDSPKLHAIGSQRKRAAVDGVAYRLEIIGNQAPSRTQDGALKLTCAKDRNGTFRQGQLVAEVSVTAGDRVEIVASTPEETEDGHLKPTALMERISRWLEEQPDGVARSQRHVEDEVEGKGAHLRTALQELVKEGVVAWEDGSYRLMFPYRKQRNTPSDKARPTASHRVPGRGERPETYRVPRPLRSRDADADAGSGTQEEEMSSRPASRDKGRAPTIEELF